MKLVSKKLVEKRGWMYEDVKHKKIASVADKCDGSIISAIKFSNGKIRMKSKMSFISEQAVMAQELYDNNKAYRALIQTMWDDNINPIFELVSPENQIVLGYQTTELILLQCRKEDGSYVSPDVLQYHAAIWELNTAEIFKYEADLFPDVQEDSKAITLDYLLHQKETSQEDIEGWVVTFEDGQMAKIKTNKYLSLHGLVGPDAFRENLLVSTIISGNIDDVISALVPGVKKDRIIELEEKVSSEYNSLVRDLFSLESEYYNFHNEDRKSFAIKWRSHKLFGAYMKNCREPLTEKVAEKAVSDYISKCTNSLGKAKEWVEGL